MSEINKKLYENLVREVLPVFREIIDTHEEVYVLGLYHCGGFDGVFPIFNTLSVLPPAPGQDAEEQELNYYYDARWAPTDYPGLEDYSCTLPDSEAALSEMRDGSGTASDRWDIALNTMVAALKAVSEDPCFEGLSPVPIFYLATYDEAWSDRTPRVKAINSPDIAATVLPEFEYMEALQAEWAKRARERIRSRYDS